MRTVTTIAAATVAAGLLAAAPASAQSSKVTGYGLNGTSLVKFDVKKPSKVKRVGKVSGLALGEELVGVDFRPKTGELIGLGNRANLYSISRSSGRATRKSSLTAMVGGAPVGLSGTSFGIDFNPTVDRLRIDSNTGQDLRVNVDTGATTVDGTLAYKAGDANAGRLPTVAGAAYRNNDNDAVVVPPAMPPAGSTPTELYVIDSGLDVLATQDPPNDGVLNTDGKLGVSASSKVGFDIYSRLAGGKAVTSTGYASLRSGGVTRLYKVNLDSGRAKAVGRFGPFGLRSIDDVAIQPQKG